MTYSTTTELDDPQLVAGASEEMTVGPRAARTQAAILDASRRLFRQRGYAGTSVNAITEECGISRAGFYTYFRDKREVFGLLGDQAYRDLRAVLAEWDSFSTPRIEGEVLGFVRSYFAYMDRHGAFAMAAGHSAPDDEEFRRGNTRMQTRISWILGRAIAGSDAATPEVIGCAAIGLLDQAWASVRTQRVAVDEGEMCRLLASTLIGMGAVRLAEE